jgi:hypothetical protein
MDQKMTRAPSVEALASSKTSASAWTSPISATASFRGRQYAQNARDEDEVTRLDPNLRQPLSPAKGWQSDISRAPRDRVILLKDPETGEVLAARFTNHPDWKWLVFNPVEGLMPPDTTWNSRWSDFIDGWNDMFIPGLLWRELPQ